MDILIDILIMKRVLICLVTVLCISNIACVWFIMDREEITTKEEADSYKSYSLLVEKTDDLQKGFYYFSDLEKCNVKADGKIVGKVIKVEEFPAQITLRVKSNEGKEFFVPFIKEFIKNVSLESQEIEVVLWEGML